MATNAIQIDPYRLAFIKPGGLTQPLPVVITTGLGGPPGLSDFILHLQPGPATPAEDVPALRAWNQSTRQDTYVAKFAKSCSVDRRGAATQIQDRTRDDRDRTPSTIVKADELVSLGIQSTMEISDKLSPVESV
jgi:hypothetical protein